MADVIKLQPGKHKIEVAAAGYKPHSFDVDATLGKPLERRIALIAEPKVGVSTPVTNPVNTGKTPTTTTSKPITKPTGDGKKCGTSFVKKKC
jgi:hypothetical protein